MHAYVNLFMMNLWLRGRMVGEGESACEHIGALVLSGGGAPREGPVHLAKEESLYLC